MILFRAELNPCIVRESADPCSGERDEVVLWMSSFCWVDGYLASNDVYKLAQEKSTTTCCLPHTMSVYRTKSLVFFFHRYTTIP